MTEKNDADLVLDYLSEVEAVAEEILASKQHLIELDKKRQKSREAIRVLQKDKSSSKQWVCFGNMFIKMPGKETKRLLEKDFDQLDKEISETRQELKPKIMQLRDLEHRDNPKGFHLNPLTKEEMRAVEQMI
ncbi:p53 and DNA damage-regulated protein 1-like [Crassostrea virginica]|uniref:P53 and DNA damage-regulated protein 1-like n=1 Tax=Crassostrea virginica TaxID=6565 RepID=A0A8B8CM50_CRAVI|nr:p53 and DNA damage-regulated protein 1-like [Crassostrea virginica]